MPRRTATRASSAPSRSRRDVAFCRENDVAGWRRAGNAGGMDERDNHAGLGDALRAQDTATEAIADQHELAEKDEPTDARWERDIAYARRMLARRERR